jgi:hypothetical protein
MEQIELSMNGSAPAEALPARIETCLADYGLQVRKRGILRTYPGSIHWHIEKPGERGTLEVTLWPAEHRLWLAVQARRRARWIEDILPQIKARIEQHINAP